MDQHWAVRIDRRDAAALGRIREAPGIRVCAVETSLWIQGEEFDEALQRALRGLPGAYRFHVLPDGQLRPWNGRVPVGKLPDGSWRPLGEWLQVELPAPALAARVPGDVSLELVRNSDVRKPDLLLTRMDDWTAYALHAPQIRLDRWRFAVCEDGRVLIAGQPLPPLPGTRFVDHGGVAAPVGWYWSPPVEAAVLCEVLLLNPGDVALLDVDGSAEHVAGDEFVRAGRSAVRKSMEAVRHV